MWLRTWYRNKKKKMLSCYLSLRVAKNIKWENLLLHPYQVLSWSPFEHLQIWGGQLTEKVSPISGKFFSLNRNAFNSSSHLSLLGPHRTYLKPLLHDRPSVLIMVLNICKVFSRWQSGLQYVITFNRISSPGHKHSYLPFHRTLSLFCCLTFTSLQTCLTQLSRLWMPFCSGCCSLNSFLLSFLCFKSVTLRTEHPAVGVAITTMLYPTVV